MRLSWRYLIVGATVLWLGVEWFFVLDGNDDTEPLTDVVVDEVPAEITITAILWLLVHFGVRYLNKRKRD